MGFLLILAVVFVVLSIIPKAETAIAVPGVKKQKVCPPHKWNYITDENGDERIKCDLCLKGPGDLGYSPRES